MSVDAAADSREDRAEHEDDELVAPGRHADGFRQRLVLADGDHVAAGRRADDGPDREGGEHRHRQGQVIEPHCAGHRERRGSQGEIGFRNARQAHVAARHADPVLGDRLSDDDEAERAHHERGRPKAQGRDPEREGDQACHEAGRDEIEVEGRPEMNRQESGRIGADAEECGLGERQKSGIADQEIEPMRREQEDQGDDDRVKRVGAR